MSDLTEYDREIIAAAETWVAFAPGTMATEEGRKLVAAVRRKYGAHYRKLQERKKRTKS